MTSLLKCPKCGWSSFSYDTRITTQLVASTRGERAYAQGTIHPSSLESNDQVTCTSCSLNMSIQQLVLYIGNNND